jgi:hypothetical protein
MLAVPMTESRAQENCTGVQFAQGQSSATIRGTAAPDQAICYSFTAAAGQTAQLKVTGNNTVVSVIGVGDARASWTFRTKAQTYIFVVAQLMRSVRPEAYIVTLSVK